MNFFRLAPVLLFALTAAATSSSRSEEIWTIGRDSFAFHEEELRQMQISVQPPVIEDVEIFVELVGIPNIPKINALGLQIRRSSGLANAFAFFHDGLRTIVYDSDWARSASPEFYLVLGHEAGHHFCGHTIESFRGNPVQMELQADRFGGASIKRFEVYHAKSFFSAVIAAAKRKYPEAASPTHPSRDDRLSAITAGYQEGSPCGDLAPVTTSGYSSVPR